MKKLALMHVLTALMVFSLVVPSGVFGQGATFGQEQLNQMVAPIALYPDSLLANVLVAATFPLEVVNADRWIKQNKNLKGDQLNAAVDGQKWDLSVKALVPFSEVLAMMSEKLDWTQSLGDAFLAQQQDVMAAIQSLRSKAQAQGNLKTTSEQKVITQGQSIVIEPASLTTVYVPSYDPAVVYGTWPYPAYPPYPYAPYRGALVSGAIGFAAGVAVGSSWNNGWGRWNWGGGTVNVNTNRNVNINKANIARVNTQSWNKFSQSGNIAARQVHPTGANAAAARADYRGYGQGSAQGGAARPAAAQLDARAGVGAAGAARSAAATRANTDSVAKGLQQQPSGGGALQGMGSGNQTRMNSDRGNISRQSSPAAMRSQGAGAGGAGISRGGAGGGAGFNRGGGEGGAARAGGGRGGHR